MDKTRFKVFHYFCTSSFNSVINSTASNTGHASLSKLRGYVALLSEKKKAHSYSKDIQVGLLASFYAPLNQILILTKYLICPCELKLKKLLE